MVRANDHENAGPLRGRFTLRLTDQEYARLDRIRLAERGSKATLNGLAREALGLLFADRLEKQDAASRDAGHGA